MATHPLLLLLLLTFLALQPLFDVAAAAANSNLFREYIGAEFKNVKFSNVPINKHVQFHFILSFAIDYNDSSSPTNGKFNVFWDSANLTPARVSSIKNKHPNVKVILSIGGDSVGNSSAFFNPSSIGSWLANAVSSLTRIIKEYDLDGIDIDYEHFQADPDTFAKCIGELIHSLKRNKVISFASIAPYDNDEVQKNYLALWKGYGHLIDYVNFQFYAYDNQTNVSQFLNYFKTQTENYRGGKVLTSFNSDGSRGLMPENGFFDACKRLKSQQQLHGIFIWSADDSKADGFRYEKQSQALLASHKLL